MPRFIGTLQCCNLRGREYGTRLRQCRVEAHLGRFFVLVARCSSAIPGENIDQLVCLVGREGRGGRCQCRRKRSCELAQADTELANAIRSDFGDATLEAFQYFNATGPLRELAGTLTSTLATTATPLTADQADKLVDILARNCPTAAGKLDINSHTLRFDAALPQASAILSPPQIAALQSAYESWHE